MENENKFIRSAGYYAKAVKFLPGGVSSSFRLGMQPFPLFFDRAQGSRIWDTDGNEYVDYVLGMGPVILGHCYTTVKEAVQKVLGSGQLFAGQHIAELELAQEICSIVPCAEMVRFGLSGSEVIQAAIRLARAFTQRNLIIKFEGQYHGWLDNILVSVHPDKKRAGEADAPNKVPGSSGQDANAYLATCILPWNDIRALHQAFEQHQGEIAAVIMEPIMCNTAVIEPQPGYLEQVRDLCRDQGAVLIFDEVITGFRVNLRGAQHLGVTPGLATFAKAMGNGYPVSCLAGRREIMDLLADDKVVHGGTFNSNTLSCAAALATIRTLKESEHTIYPRLVENGTALMDGLRDVARALGIPLHVQGLPMVFHTTFTDQARIHDYRSYQNCDLDLQNRFVANLLDHGVRITGRGTWFLSAAHTQEDVELTLKAARASLESMRVSEGAPFRHSKTP